MGVLADLFGTGVVAIRKSKTFRFALVNETRVHAMMEEIDLQAIATALLDGQGLPGKPRSACQEETDQEPRGYPDSPR